VGLKFAQFLMDSNLARAVVGAGNADNPDLLLQAMQAGILEFLPSPWPRIEVGGSWSGFGGKPERPSAREAGSQLGQLLSVFSPKGGSGATTFAVNLAVAIHQLPGSGP
jgi:Mrp family chromosome partitioning ATPase